MNPLIQRLTESVDSRPFRGAAIAPVIVDSRPVEFWRCPHCKEEIYEKHTYVEEGIERHSDCGGPIQPPPYDWSKVSPEWRALLQGKTST